jgi:hypothetical protein
MTKVTTVAVAWLRKEDWPRWQAIDSELAPYDRWLAKISQAITQIEREGGVAEKITVEPDAFLEWCRANGLPVHSNTRAQYAAAQLMRRMDFH